MPATQPTPAHTPPPRPRIAALVKVITSELEHHPELEDDHSLRTISLVVVLHERTGRPVRIMLRTEGQRDLNEQPRRLSE